MVELAVCFVAVFVGGALAGTVLGTALGETIGRILHRKPFFNMLGQAIGVGLVGAIYMDQIGLGRGTPGWLFPVGVGGAAFLLHRFEGQWWWAAPVLALGTAYGLLEVLLFL
jgi:hypothetical protein